MPSVSVNGPGRPPPTSPTCAVPDVTLASHIRVMDNRPCPSDFPAKLQPFFVCLAASSRCCADTAPALTGNCTKTAPPGLFQGRRDGPSPATYILAFDAHHMTRLQCGQYPLASEHSSPSPGQGQRAWPIPADGQRPCRPQGGPIHLTLERELSVGFSLQTRLRLICGSACCSTVRTTLHASPADKHAVGR